MKKGKLGDAEKIKLIFIPIVCFYNQYKRKISIKPIQLIRLQNNKYENECFFFVFMCVSEPLQMLIYIYTKFPNHERNKKHIFQSFFDFSDGLKLYFLCRIFIKFN